MARKIRASVKSKPRRPQKTASKKSKKSVAAKNPLRRKPSRKNPLQRRKKSAADPVLAMIRPPPPGEGKRGEQGHLAYLLRQAQAATRLTLERALGRTRRHHAAIRGADDAAGLSRPVGRRSRAGRPADPANRRRHHPQSGTRRRHPEDPAPDPRPGAAMDADPARHCPARQMPPSRPGGGAAAGGRALGLRAGDGPALARTGSPRTFSRPRAAIDLPEFRVPAATTAPRKCALVSAPCPVQYRHGTASIL